MQKSTNANYYRIIECYNLSVNTIKKVKKYCFILGLIFIMYIFSYMTKKVPLAGDDWGYALFTEGSPFAAAYKSFNYLSGRYFSELWSYAIIPHREVWNYVNPLIFAIMFLSLYKLNGKRKKPIVSFLLIIAMILSVFFQIRTQTYTWMSGGIYTVSLCLSLIYFVIVDGLFKCDVIDSKHKILSLLSNLILFIIGLMMENIAAAMIAGIVILIIYAYKTKKKNLLLYLIINLLFSAISFAILRLSPGSTNRLLRDHADWMNLGLFGQIAYGYRFFVEYSFINNNYTIGLFSMVMCGLVWFSKNKNPLWLKIVSSLILITGIISVFYSNIFNDVCFINNSMSLFSIMFWPLFIINAFVVMFAFLEKGYEKNKSIFFLLFGGMSAAAMIMSPVNGARSYVYLIYYVILVSEIILNSYKSNKYICFIFGLGLLFIIYLKTNYYKGLYDSIECAQEQRLIEIEYYKEHPEDEEVWIKRFPKNALHSVDVEDGDNYHFNVFKQYYNLPQSADNIVFYFDKKSNN